MTDRVNTRAYDSPRRRAAAEQTRQRLLDTAADLFVARGYAATTMTAIAAGAGVALDTVYAAVGPKPALFRLLIERAISNAGGPVPALERDYVRAVRAEPDPWRKLELYATAVARVQDRLAPLFRVLQQAAPAHPDLDALWHEIAEQRARNMQLLAAELVESGGLREGVSVEEAADVLWTMNAAEFYALLAQARGWGPERFARWLAAAWQRLLLRER